MAAHTVAAAALIDAIEKPCFLPILFISRVAGIALAAIERIAIEMGKVAKFGFFVNSDPIMPPNVTKTIAPVADMSWQLVRITILRRGINKSGVQRNIFSHILCTEPTYVENF
tara:strand:+ start:2204 stop:2542 length:339 start_codon:yes stop_codon:yes gene_type:complete